LASLCNHQLVSDLEISFFCKNYWLMVEIKI
ncbi:hypothetical protein NPIL_651121, partial [Nephila pilipes]